MRPALLVDMNLPALEHNSAHATAVGRENGQAAFSLPLQGAHLGNLLLLKERLTALFCSNRCPGDLILKTYDIARALRDAGVPVVGGFQTPMEKECLRLLLRGSQPVVICPARGIENMRIPRDWRPALDAGRLLIISPFSSAYRRPTAKLAAGRNHFVASLAKYVLITHATPNGNIETLARELVTTGKFLLTLPGSANANLLALGAQAVEPEDAADVIFQHHASDGNTAMH